MTMFMPIYNLQSSFSRAMQADKEELLKQYFQLVRVLGQGAFGKVYLIRNRFTQKQYALKRYNRNHLQKRGKYRNLIRSIFILQSLSHPSVIQFVNYIISPDETTIYLLFECCKKGSLQKIKRVMYNNNMVQVIKYVLYQLALALKYIKSMDVAHRDIKVQVQ